LQRSDRAAEPRGHAKQSAAIDRGAGRQQIAVQSSEVVVIAHIDHCRPKPAASV
jgi:hypothetical protein